MSSPEEVKYVLDHTDAVGHVAAITVQNAPIERAVSEAVKAFGSLTMKKVKMQH
jgi:predicted TIM-barrel enzyme